MKNEKKQKNKIKKIRKGLRKADLINEKRRKRKGKCKSNEKK